MKKIFSAFVIAVCCMFMAMPAQAQLLKWGVKGGVNMTKIDWDGGYKGNKDNSTGFFIGPMAEWSDFLVFFRFLFFVFFLVVLLVFLFFFIFFLFYESKFFFAETETFVSF